MSVHTDTKAARLVRPRIVRELDSAESRSDQYLSLENGIKQLRREHKTIQRKKETRRTRRKVCARPSRPQPTPSCPRQILNKRTVRALGDAAAQARYAKHHAHRATPLDLIEAVNSLLSAIFDARQQLKKAFHDCDYVALEALRKQSKHYARRAQELRKEIVSTA